MEEFVLLGDLLVVFAVAAAAVFLFSHLRVPSVVGLLFAGLLVGPSGLSLVSDEERVHVLAEIGVVVLLFTVGLDFSLSRLWRMWQVMLTVGLWQVLFSGVIAELATGWYLGGAGPAIFAGMLVAMSSTAVVLKVLGDRGELGAPQGRVAIAVLLFQDLLVVVFMLVLPLLSPKAQEDVAVWPALGLGFGVILLVLAAARFLVPPLLYQVVRTRNRELFLSVIVVLCLGTATLTAWSGLSLALGAFLAGLAVSESEYAHQTLAEVLPFRDTLSSLFFVSVGMLLDLKFVALQWPLITITVVAIMALKFVAVAAPVWLIGYPLRATFLSALALVQVGEFSFVLAGRGLQFDLLRESDYQTFIAAAVVTMALTPLIIAAGPRLLEKLPIDEGRQRRRPALGGPEPHGEQMHWSDHVIIAGYGVNGRNVARVLRDVKIPYAVLEMNPATVREARAQGEPIYFGDCSRTALLEHLRIGDARLLVVAVSDPTATRLAVQTARRLNSHLHIIVRTRYVAEVEQLRALGADEIIPEEFETSVEIFSRVLAEYQVPRNMILDLIDRIRRDHYEILRHPRALPRERDFPVDLLSGAEVSSVLLRDHSPAIGRTIGELKLRATTGATVIGVRRGEHLTSNPGPQLRFEPGDIVVLIGDRQQVTRALELFDPELAQPARGPEPQT